MGDMTKAERRSILMAAFKAAVENNDVEAAAKEFLDTILPAHNNHWGEAIADVATSFVGCSFQTAVSVSTMLSVLEHNHPVVVQAIETAAESKGVELKPREAFS